MGATETDTNKATVQSDARSASVDAVELARRYVAAYNDRDLDAMLALQDEDVVSYPSRLFGHQAHTGHAGVRAWWARMVAAGRWYDVAVHEVRQLDAHRVAVMGEIRDEGQVLGPWAVVIRIRNGLIVESRSYLSDAELLDQLGVLR